MSKTTSVVSVDVSDIFYFFCSGKGKAESEVLGGGDRGSVFFIQNPRRGGGSPAQEGPKGREGVCGKLGNFFWGGG